MGLHNLSQFDRDDPAATTVSTSGCTGALARFLKPLQCHDLQAAAGFPVGSRMPCIGTHTEVYFPKKILNRVDCQRSGQRSKHTKQTRNQQNTQLRYILFTTSRPRRLHPGEHWKRKEKGASPVCERMIHRFKMPLHAGNHSKSSSHRLRLCSRGLLTWCFSRQ